MSRYHTLPGIVLLLVYIVHTSSSPQYLPCGSDESTLLLEGQSIMGYNIYNYLASFVSFFSYSSLQVGAKGDGGLRISAFHQNGEPALSFAPGEELELELGGLPDYALFAVRVSDNGGELKALQNSSTAMSNKCLSQMYADNTASAETAAPRALLTTPCDNAPAVVNVTLVAAPWGFGPFYIQTIALHRSKDRDPKCAPPAPASPPPYPFVYPLNATCPTYGAAAQHGAPCPDVPCVSPIGKNGTCLVIDSWPQQITPLHNATSIMAEARVELLTDSITPISHHYVTGSAPPPRAWTRNMSGWSLRVDGEVASPHSFTMQELQSRFPVVSRQYVLECASNWGRGMVPVYQQADWWSVGGVSG